MKNYLRTQISSILMKLSIKMAGWAVQVSPFPAGDIASPNGAGGTGPFKPK